MQPSSVIAMKNQSLDERIPNEEEEESVGKELFIIKDITIEILQYLPLRSLARFKCVSNQWRNHISTDCLIRSCRSPSRSSLLFAGFFFQDAHETKVMFHYFSTFNRSGYDLSWKNPLYHISKSSIKIIASSNGFLLCGRMNNNPIVHYYVCDPRTNQVISLTKPRNVFTPVKIGFHAERITNESDPICFTVVRFSVLDLTSIEIYSSDSQNWIRIAVNFDIPFPVLLLFESPYAHFMDGVFYWTTWRSQIFAFDLLNNTCSMLDLPPESIQFQQRIIFRRLNTTNGALQLLTTDRVYIEVWACKARIHEWTLKHRIRVEGFFANVPEQGIGIVGFLPSDDTKIFLNTLRDVWMYDLKSKKLEMVFYNPISHLDEYQYFPCEIHG